jgi:hypothetical protein
VVYEYRDPADYKFGTLSLAAAISDTTLNSANFASLVGGLLSTTRYVPMVLHDPTIPAYEVVWITAHTAAATSVTVVRGKEGTAARAWPSQTQWLIAPTIRDALAAVANAAALPSEPHTGMRALQLDTGAVVERTRNQGWASPPISNPADVFGPHGGAAVPVGSRPIFKSGVYQETSDGGSLLVATLPGGGFPTATKTVLAQVANGILRLVLESYTTTTATFSVWNGNSAAGGGQVVTFHLMATGY